MIFEKIGSCSVSWKPPRPIVIEPVSGVIIDDRRMRPVGRRDSGYKIGDARTVLADADAMATRHARVAVGHVHRALLVRDWNEANPGGREDIECIHVRGTDDAEDIGHTLRHHGFDERL